MKKQQVLKIIIPLVVSLLPYSYAFAQTTAVSPTPGTSRMQAKADARISSLQSKGDQLISDRLTSLNNITARLNTMKRLSSTEKTTLTTNVTSAINGLTALKTKIDADTDLTTTQVDVKSIYTTYRVYAEFDPQTSLLAVSDVLTTATDQLTDLATKLQTRINEASASGTNVTTMTNALTDMQSSIADATSQYTTVEKNISVLTPQSYNTDPIGVHSTFVSSRSSLRVARNDVQTALQDAKKIVAILKTIKPTVSPTSGAASPSAQPSS